MNLREKPRILSSDDVKDMLKKHNFFHFLWNKSGQGIAHQYKEQIISGDKVIFDEATGLMWQQGGFFKEVIIEKADRFANELDYAGFQDWRLPTLEEAMSLMEPEKKNGDLYVDSVFDARQEWIWTADLFEGRPWAWVVSFNGGDCHYEFDFYYYIRAVRSGQSSNG